jgi:hypothetical protein
MIVIVGLVVLLVAVIVGFTGVLTNAGAAHPLTENFAVFGYHVTGSTGTLFLSGIVVGAVAMLGLCVLRGHHPPQQGSPARSLVASSTTDGHRARGRTPVGSDTPVEFCQPAVAACHHRERRNPQ